MVGPISEEERRATEKKVKTAATVLVGLSAGLITLWMDASPVIFLGAVAAGLIVGGLLIWFVFPETTGIADDHRRR